jgi:hypothetical protein
VFTFAIGFLTCPFAADGEDALSRPPTPGERRHRGLARRLVAVRRRAILMMPEGWYPRRFYWRSVNLEDAAVGQHIVIVVVPIAGWATS